MSEPSPSEVLRQRLQGWLALIALAFSGGSQLLTWVTTGYDLKVKVERLLEVHAELKLRTEAIEHRGITTANEVMQLNTGVQALAKEVESVKAAVEQPPSKRGRAK